MISVPVVQTNSLRSINRLRKSGFRHPVAPDESNEVHVNINKNLIAIELHNACALDKVLLVTRVCCISGMNAIAGVIQDVDFEIMKHDLAALISTAVSIVQFRRFGISSSVKIEFKDESLPASVKAVLVCYPVRPHMHRPLQCRQCMQLGHVIDFCP